MFKFLKHTADAKIYVKGDSIEEIFKESLNAINNFLKPKIRKNTRVKNLIIEIPKNKLPDLLIDFLSEVLSRIYIEKMIFKIKKISFNDVLRVELEGKEFTSLTKEIKAITYHQAKLENKQGKYIAEFIVDI